MTDKPKIRRPGAGFAAMARNNPERHRELSGKGGESVAAENRPFSRDPGLAREAGKLGGAKRKKLAAARRGNFDAAE
jgi:general stress protein YciG